MIVTTRTLETALGDLRGQLTETGGWSVDWRGGLRQTLASLRDALGDETFRTRESWLASRCTTGNREKTQLLGRISQAGSSWLDLLDPERIVSELTRLANDIERHHQRIHDLIYDAVSLELGGSE